MQLSLKTFASLVETMAASVQSAASQLIDLTAGSTLRAILEANASVALWMQWLILQVLQATRAATSAGADLDSWMADFSVSRLPAVAAQGTVTFARYTPSAPALIPVGAQVRTADGSQLFSVVADAASASFSAAQNGYVLPAAVASIDVPVAASAAGSSGNVQAGAVSLLATAIPGIDAVSNAVAFQNGNDPEADAALRSRFQNFIASRSRATPAAVGYAITSLQQGLQYVIAENADASGAPRIGSFLVVVDDGSGAPPASLLSTISAAVEAVRPIGSTFSIQAPSVLAANITLTITVTPPAQKSSIIPVVAAAVAAYVNALPIGVPLPVTRIAQLAFAADPSVANVSQISINGGASDLTPRSTAVVKTVSVVVD